MKTTSVFAAITALALAATSVGLAAQAQSDAKAPPAPASMSPSAVPPSPASSGSASAPAAAPAPTPASSAAASGSSTDAKLTEDEAAQAVAIILNEDKCMLCHGTEEISDKHFNKVEWQAVLDDMGPSANLTRAETALVLRYLVENYGPPAKP